MSFAIAVVCKIHRWKLERQMNVCMGCYKYVCLCVTASSIHLLSAECDAGKMKCTKQLLQHAAAAATVITDKDKTDATPMNGKASGANAQVTTARH